MKFVQVIERNNRNILFKSHVEIEAGRLVPDRFLFSLKALYEVKASDLQLNFNNILIALDLAYNKNIV